MSCLHIKNVVQVIEANPQRIFNHGIEQAGITIYPNTKQILLRAAQVGCPGGRGPGCIGAGEDVDGIGNFRLVYNLSPGGNLAGNEDTGEYFLRYTLLLQLFPDGILVADRWKNGIFGHSYPKSAFFYLGRIDLTRDHPNVHRISQGISHTFACPTSRYIEPDSGVEFLELFAPADHHGVEGPGPRNSNGSRQPALISLGSRGRLATSGQH